MSKIMYIRREQFSCGRYPLGCVVSNGIVLNWRSWFPETDRVRFPFPAWCHAASELAGPEQPRPAGRKLPRLPASTRPASSLLKPAALGRPLPHAPAGSDPCLCLLPCQLEASDGECGNSEGSLGHSGGSFEGWEVFRRLNRSAADYNSSLSLSLCPSLSLSLFLSPLSLSLLSLSLSHLLSFFLSLSLPSNLLSSPLLSSPLLSSPLLSSPLISSHLISSLSLSFPVPPSLLLQRAASRPLPRGVATPPSAWARP